MWIPKVWEPWFKSPSLWNLTYFLVKWAKTHPGSPAAMLFSFHEVMFFIDQSAGCFVWYKCREHLVDSNVSVGEMSHWMEGWWNRSKLSPLALFLSWLTLPSQLPGAHTSGRQGICCAVSEAEWQSFCQGSRRKTGVPRETNKGPSVGQGRAG